jgi:protein subunit release factor A
MEIEMKLVLEVRAAEGGEDARQFAQTLVLGYQKMFSRFG